MPFSTHSQCSIEIGKNTISIISCAWFPPRESGLASSIILNCYQLGIMLSFVFGTLGVNSEDDVDDYFQLLSIMSVLAFILVAFLVDDAPSNILLRPDQNHLHQEHLTQRRKKINTVTNGHKSRMSRRDITERNKDLDIEAGDLKSEAKPFLETLLPPVPSPMSEQYEYGSVGQTASPTSIQINTDLDFLSPKAAQDQIWPLMKIMLSYSGSSHCALAYVTGGVVINTLLTFICDIVKMNEGSNREIWVIGVSFPLVTMLSSYLFEKVVSRSRKLYRPILTLLAIGSVALLMCAVWPGASLNMSICILIVGFLVIPLQLLSTVLGSRVASPASNDSGKLLMILLFSHLPNLLMIGLQCLSYNDSCQMEQVPQPFQSSTSCIITPSQEDLNCMTSHCHSISWLELLSQALCTSPRSAIHRHPTKMISPTTKEQEEWKIKMHNCGYRQGKHRGVGSFLCVKSNLHVVLD